MAVPEAGFVCGSTVRGRPRGPELLFLIESLRAGGAERQLAELALGLRRRGVRVSIHCWVDDLFFAPSLQQAGVDVTLTARTSRWDLRPLLAARDWIRGGADRLVQGVLDTGNLLGVLGSVCARRRRAIASHRTSWNALRWHTSLHKRLSHRLAVRTIANSQAGSEALKRHLGVDPQRIAMIPNGIDTRRFRPVEAGRRRDLRNELGWPRDSHVFLTVASLTEVKNPTGFLEAVSQSALRGRAKFAWFGASTPAELDRLREHARSQGVAELVHFYPPRADIEKAYAAADSFVLFSNREGTPNCVIEAMASGLPIIASEVGDVPRLLEGESYAALVPPRDTEALASALDEALAHPRSVVTDDDAPGRRRVVELGLDVETMVSRHLELYSSLV